MGEIVMSGDLVMMGYYKMPDKTAETIIDGWLHIGDIGYIDSRGYVFIKDRIRDVVITGGFNGLTQASFVTALRALPAIVIGGLDSLVGAVVGSLIIGMTQGYIAYYQLSIEAKIGFSFGTGFSSLAPYVIMFFILIVKPDGLFGKEEVERV